jgi:hypothetical protein
VSSGFGRAPSRREFLQVLAGTGAGLTFGAGVQRLFATEAPLPVFTDVTAEAGLARAMNISGSTTNKQFLLEENGLWCGAVRL